MLVKGSKLFSYVYNLDNSDRFFYIRAASTPRVFSRLYERYCFDVDRRITIRLCPDQLIVYDGFVSGLAFR